MANDVNRVTLHGRLGTDPEIRELLDGGKVANLSVSTSENWKDEASGEWTRRTQWHRVAVFSQALVKVTERKLHKGSQVQIKGQLENRKWVDKRNIERYATEVVVRPLNGALKVVETDVIEAARPRRSGAKHKSQTASLQHG